MGGVAPTVLVVDDDDALRMLCRVNLELEGYRVVEAESAQAAEEALAREPVDVVLLDVHIGRDDGRTLIEGIRRARPGAAIALFTGSAQVTPAQRDEVEAVLTKPFTLEQLSGTIERLVSRCR